MGDGVVQTWNFWLLSVLNYLILPGSEPHQQSSVRPECRRLGLLKYSFSLTECRHSASHWNQTRGPHLASSSSVALASCAETCWLKAGMFRLLVFVRPGTSVLGWQHTLGFGRSKTSTPLVHRQIVCCSTDAQHIWRQKLCCRRATSLEQPPSTLVRKTSVIAVFGVNSKHFGFNVASFLGAKRHPD